MYRFPCYWSGRLIINFLQRVILIHSYLYYEGDSPRWTDKHFDEIAKQLVNEQKKYDYEYIKENTQYGYVFYDFDGTTGFDLWSRLNKVDKKHISNIAMRLVNE